MLFTEKQLGIIRYTNTHNQWLTILEGSIRSGKSYLNNWLWLKHINKYRNESKQFIITGTNLSSLERNVFVDIRNTFGIPVRLQANNTFKLLGNEMRCFGADQADSYESITGFTSYGWYANEVTHHDPNAVKESLGRCSGEGARIFWDCNPDAPNHFIKKDYIDRADGKVIQSFHFVIEDNPTLPADYVENIKSTTPSGVYYDRKILGLWTSAEGMIYRDWNSDLMVIEAPKYDIRTYIAGVDWGYDHLGVIVVLGIDGDGNYYLVDEITDREKTIDWWNTQRLELLKKYPGVRFYCDSARPEYVKAFNGVEADKGVVQGIESVASLMRKKKFFIIRTTGKQFHKEIYYYRWDTNAVKEQPIKENDDVLDAIRYAIHTYNRTKIDIVPSFNYATSLNTFNF